MYDTPKSAVIEETNINRIAKLLKWLNLTFITIMLTAILLRVLAFPGFESSVPFRFFAAFMLCLFTVPYFLAVKAYNSGYTKTTAAKVVSIIWCIFIVIGVTSQPQGIFVNIFCGIMFILSTVNLVFIFTKFGIVSAKT